MLLTPSLFAQESLSFYENKSPSYVGIIVEGAYYLPVESADSFTGRNMGVIFLGQILGNVNNVFGIGTELGVDLAFNAPLLIGIPIRAVFSFDFDRGFFALYGGPAIRMAITGDYDPDAKAALVFDVGIRGGVQLGAGKFIFDVGYVLPTDPIHFGDGLVSSASLVNGGLHNIIVFSVGYQFDMMI